jgi:hypothetical protein
MRMLVAVSVAKLANVLVECIAEDQRFYALFSGQKGSIKRIFLKKYFLFTVESAYRVKRFTTGSRNPFKDVKSGRICPTKSPS